MVAKSCTCLKTVVNIPLFIGFPPYKVVQDFATIAGIHQFHIWNCGNCSYCYWMLMVYGRHMRVSEHGGFPVVTMLVSIQGPWSSMTTGWFGGTPKFREPPYGNIGINQCISCYIMCVHTHIYIKKDIYHEDLFSTWTSRMTCNEVPAKIGGFFFRHPLSPPTLVCRGNLSQSWMSLDCWLVVYLPLWKRWGRQLGWWQANIWKNQIHVPNHRPDWFWGTFTGTPPIFNGKHHGLRCRFFPTKPI